MVTIEGDFTVVDGRYAVVASRFNALVVDRLVDGALDALGRHGVAAQHIDVVRVPGAFELPQVCRQLADQARYQAVIALGCVIRGATPHFDYVASAAANGLSQLAATTDCAISFGVLTTDTLEQALERAGSKAGNKGYEAALSALEMVSLLARLKAAEDE